jgi:uncharacterized protein (DUF433 family)
LASGVAIPEVLKPYPGITEEDVPAHIVYGAETLRERYVEIPAGRE